MAHASHTLLFLISGLWLFLSSCSHDVVRCGEVETATNIFSPNKDGEDDVWTIEMKFVTESKLTIYDIATGKVVFTSEKPIIVWDGTDLEGNPVRAGIYACKIHWKDLCNQSTTEWQKVALLR